MTRREMIAEARRLLALAWPIALTNLQWMILNITDTALVGLYSTTEAGELAAGRTIMYVTVVMGLAGLTGVLVFSGRADGAGDRRAAGDALRQGLALALVAGTAVMALILLTADLMEVAFGIPPELRGGGAEFARVMAIALPFQLAFAATTFRAIINHPVPAVFLDVGNLQIADFRNAQTQAQNRINNRQVALVGRIVPVDGVEQVAHFLDGQRSALRTLQRLFRTRHQFRRCRIAIDNAVIAEVFKQRTQGRQFGRDGMRRKAFVLPPSSRATPARLRL